MNHAVIEARCFVSFVCRGTMTVKAARELIGVSEAEEKELRRFLDLAVVERLLGDRGAILYEFNRQIAEFHRPRDRKRRRPYRNVRECPTLEARSNSLTLSL